MKLNSIFQVFFLLMCDAIKQMAYEHNDDAAKINSQNLMIFFFFHSVARLLVRSRSLDLFYSLALFKPNGHCNCAPKKKKQNKR